MAPSHQTDTDSSPVTSTDPGCGAKELSPRTPFEATGDGTWTWDLASGEILWSPGQETIFGFASGTLRCTYKDFESRIHPGDRDGLARAVRCARLQRVPYAHEYRVVWPDGSIHQVRGRGWFEFDADGGPVRMRGAVADVTGHRQAMEAAREGDAGFRLMFEHSLSPSFVVDERGILACGNDAFMRSFADTREAIPIGRPVEELYAQPDKWRMHLSWLRAGEPIKFREVGMKTASGRARHVLLTLVRTSDDASGTERIYGSILDETDRHDQARQVGHSGRLEAVGRLTSGLTHDFNNILSVVLAASDLALTRTGTSPEIRRLLKEIKTASERGALMTQRLLAFARPRDSTMTSVDLAALLRDTMSLCARLLPESIAFELDLPSDACTILADEAQIEQAVVNLVINARDAMPQGGLLRVSATRAPRPASVKRLDERPDWPHVEVRIADTGTGIETGALARIFEPFFSTKEPGAGSGLGLAMVRRAVEESGGSVDIVPETRVGTTFRILLPLQVEESPPSSAQGPPPRGCERVLVVESDPFVRRVVCTLLRSLGYQVLEAESRAPARELLRRHRIDLTLASALHLGSHESIASLVADCADTRIMAMPGRREDASLVPSGIRRLAKPFTIAQLAVAVRAELDRTVRTSE